MKTKQYNLLVRACAKYLVDTFRPGKLMGPIVPMGFNYTNPMFTIATGAHFTLTGTPAMWRTMKYTKHGHQGLRLAHRYFPRVFSSSQIPIDLTGPTGKEGWMSVTNMMMPGGEKSVYANHDHDTTTKLDLGRFPIRWLHMINDFYLEQSGIVEEVATRAQLDELTNLVEYELAAFPPWWFYWETKNILQSSFNGQNWSIQVFQGSVKWSAPRVREILNTNLVSANLGSLDGTCYEVPTPGLTVKDSDVGTSSYITNAATPVEVFAPLACPYLSDIFFLNHLWLETERAQLKLHQGNSFFPTFGTGGDVNLEELAIFSEVLRKAGYNSSLLTDERGY